MPVARTSTSSLISMIVAASAVFAGTAAQAAVLTFEVFSNSTKTTQISGSVVPQQYGDNITDFSPSAAINPPTNNRWANYGSAGGPTPNITTSYTRYPSTLGVGGTTTDPATVWNTAGGAYDTLTNGVLTSASGYTTTTGKYVEIRFTPTTGWSVELTSFMLGTFSNPAAVDSTLVIVQDFGTANQVTLWTPAGVTGITGAATGIDDVAIAPTGGVPMTFTPNVIGKRDSTVSLIFSFIRSDTLALDNRWGLDNITFSQVPEPTTASILIAALAAATRRKRR